MTSEGLQGLQTYTRHPLLVKVPKIIARKLHKQFFQAAAAAEAIAANGPISCTENSRTLAGYHLLAISS